MEEGRESKGKLMKKTKRERISRREREKERDRLSELPDCILLYIMKFMNTKYAVQTCILSKRWKNLWKRLIVLTFYPWDFRRVVNFKQFVSKVLSCRNGSISLLNLCILAHRKGTMDKLKLKRTLESGIDKTEDKDRTSRIDTFGLAKYGLYAHVAGNSAEYGYNRNA
ncbi:hypothetical protein JHK82_028065 [Glycine max]|nr:hypothetical protein JHK86_028189 [Glycine max]KAG5127230.1 hypothetical protein JHK82_028065 [Glycine max]KAG5151842.1 hypothetical protein JHK84_028314 [Glycine max]